MNYTMVLMPAEADGKEDIINYLVDQKAQEDRIARDKANAGLAGALAGYALGFITGGGLFAFLASMMSSAK